MSFFKASSILHEKTCIHAIPIVFKFAENRIQGESMKPVSYLNMPLMLCGICLVFVAGCGGSQESASTEQSQVIPGSSSSLEMMAMSKEAAEARLNPFNSKAA